MRRAVVFACAVFATACLNINPVQPTVSLGSPFDLKVGETAVGPGGLTIRFDAVPSDSRCPINALCVTAGEARIAMTVRSDSRSPVQREWRTNPTNFRVTYDDYAIELRELRPYPAGGPAIPQGEYVATLLVQR